MIWEWPSAIFILEQLLIGLSRVKALPQSPAIESSPIVKPGCIALRSIWAMNQVFSVVKACCHPRFCLKRRLWGLGSLESDTVQAKSIIPCLEPCALLLEFARTAARIEQSEMIKPPLTVEDASTISASLKATGSANKIPRSGRPISAPQGIHDVFNCCSKNSTPQFARRANVS